MPAGPGADSRTVRGARVSYNPWSEASADRRRLGLGPGRRGGRDAGAAADPARARHDGGGRGSGDRGLHGRAGARAAAGGGAARALVGPRRRSVVRRRVDRLRERGLAGAAARDAGSAGAGGRSAAGRGVRRARRRRHGPPDLDRRGGRGDRRRAGAAPRAPRAGAAPRAPRAGAAPRAPRDLLAALALTLLSGALTAVVFLLVLLLISGWSVEPLAAAAAVSVLPVAAVAGSYIRGPAATRAVAGCLLVAGGIACLALLPEASVAWTLAPQLPAGAGMGMAFPALAGELLPEQTRGHAAGLLSLRHAGITLVLVALAPIVAAGGGGGG